MIEFLVREWMQPTAKASIQNKQLFVTCKNKCFLITSKLEQEIAELESSQEEADTRLLLHAAHAAHSGDKAVIVVAEDTDVFALCVAFSHDISSPLYQKQSTKTRTRLIDIKKVANAYGPDVCKAILGTHAITGCDSVSSFAGKGKVLALKLVQRSKNNMRLTEETGPKFGSKC